MEYLVASGHRVGPTFRHCPRPEATSEPQWGSGHREAAAASTNWDPGVLAVLPTVQGPSSRQEIPTGLRSALLGSPLAVFKSGFQRLP